MSACKWMNFKMLLMVLSGLMAALPAAAIMLSLDMDTMVTSAESVVSGRVVSLDCHWLDGPRSIIVTDVGFAVSEIWMGSKHRPGEQITVRIAGGVVGEIFMRQEHQPVFRQDEEAVLFLGTRPNGQLGIAQAEQGVYKKSGDSVFGHIRDLQTITEFRSSLERSKRNLGRQ